MNIIDSITNKLTGSILRYFKNIEDELVGHLALRINNLKRKILIGIASLFILMIAFLFLSLSLIFLFIEYYHLSKTLSFAIMGLFYLFIVILIRIIK